MDLTPPQARDLGPVEDFPPVSLDATAPRWRERSAEERDALELANGRDPLVRRLNGCAALAGLALLLTAALLALLR